MDSSLSVIIVAVVCLCLGYLACIGNEVRPLKRELTGEKHLRNKERALFLRQLAGEWPEVETDETM